MPDEVVAPREVVLPQDARTGEDPAVGNGRIDRRHVVPLVDVGTRTPAVPRRHDDPGDDDP